MSPSRTTTSHGRRRILSAAAVGVTAIALAATGCSGNAGSSDTAPGQVAITWSTWGTPAELDRFKEFNKDFMKRHPDIEVTLQAVPSYGDYHPKLLAQLSSGTAPDVFYVGDDNIGKFVSAGVLAPLGERMAAPGSKAQPDDFFEGLYGGAKKDGRVYGIPTDCNPEVLWFDEQALKEAGITENPAKLHERGEWTMSTYLEMNDKLRAAGKAGSIFYNWYGSTYSMISGFGGEVYEDGKFVATTDPASRKALRTLAEGHRDKTFLVADNLPEGNGGDVQFLKHEAGFFAGGRWMIDTVAKSDDKNGYDIVPFPSQNGEPAPGAVAAAYLSLNKDSDHGDAAWTFLSEFVAKEGQILRLKDGGNAVPSVKGADSVVLEGYPEHAKTFLEVRNTGFANYPEEVGVPGLTADVNASLMRLWTGKVGFEEEMTDLDQLVNSRLK